MEPYSRYDAFAWYYRTGWGADFHAQFRPLLAEHVFPRLPEGSRVLDVCCGSGDLSAYLVQQGYRVTGFDGSAEMLRYAREKVPDAEFFQDDVRHVVLPPEADAAICAFDSLNHILVLEELECAFRNVCGALRTGGLFAFDMNMEENFLSLWRGSFSVVQDDAVGITQGSYNPGTRIGRADVTLFRRQETGLWSRSDIAVEERCYEQEDILLALQHAGFTQLEARDAYELGMHTDFGIGRDIFFAVK